MQNPLSSVYIQIYENLAPHLLLKNNQNANEGSLPGQEAVAELSAIHPIMVEQLMRAGHRSALTVTVQLYQANLCSFLNRLDHYTGLVQQYHLNKKTISGLQAVYGQLQESILPSLTYLETYFAPYLDLRQPVPSFVWARKRNEWAAQLPSLKESWLVYGEEGELIRSAFLILNKHLSGDFSPSYQQLYYLQTFLAELEAETQTSLSFPDLLRRANFNHPKLIDDCLRHILQKMPEDASPADEIGYLFLQLKNSRQQCHHNVKWLPNYPSFTEALCRYLQQEILYRQRKMKTNNQSQNIQPNEAAIPLATTLSVGQLAVMMRLLVDCGIIQSHNQSELLKRVAHHVTTTKTTKISAESLRVKYYAPDRAAINIAQEHLHSMLVTLRKL